MNYKLFILLTITFLYSSFQLKGNGLDTIPMKKAISLDKIKDVQTLNKNEHLYIVTRDRMRMYFQKHKFKSWDDAIYKRQKDSLKELDRVLKHVFNDVPLYKKMPDNFWGINAETLYDEPLTSYDMLDGLYRWKSFEDSLPLFFTTDNLFYHYFKKDGISSFANLSSHQLEKIIYQTFFNDAVFTNFISYKLPSAASCNAYAILGLGAQDYPFAPPNLLYILISKGGNTYIRWKEIKNNLISPIPICEKLKDSATIVEKKYISDSKLQDKHVNQIVKMYCNCYSENIKLTKQYSKLQKMIDETYSDLLNRIK